MRRRKTAQGGLGTWLHRQPEAEIVVAVHALYVSLNQTFRATMDLAAVEVAAERAWALTVGKASACDRVIAVVDQKPVAAWRLRGAYPTNEAWSTVGGERPRIALSLGPALPVLPEYSNVPVLRRGCATQQVDVEPLEPETR